MGAVCPILLQSQQNRFECERSLFVAVRRNGWDVAEPGNYTIQVALHLCDMKSCFTNAFAWRSPPQHSFARRRAIPLAEVAAEPLIGLARADYPNYYDLLALTFSKVKQKPRVIEEHDSMSAVMSAVEAGTGVAVAVDFGYSFGNRVKFLHVLRNQNQSRSASSR